LKQKQLSEQLSKKEVFSAMFNECKALRNDWVMTGLCYKRCPCTNKKMQEHTAAEQGAPMVAPDSPPATTAGGSG
jgi:hypothetical protein